MNKDDWLKWHYENNAPFAIIKTGISHAIYWSLAIFIFSVFIEIGKFSGLTRLAYFSVITFFATSLFLLIVSLPLIFIHWLHYKIFKKALLQNKLEKTVTIGLILALTHFLIIYFSIDFLTLSLNLKLSPIEFTYISFAYILGLLKGFVIFHNNFYKSSLGKEDDSQVWQLHIGKKEKYF